MSKELSLTAIEYSMEYGDPVIHLFGRDKNRNRHRIDFTGFEPYLYVSNPGSKLIRKSTNIKKVEKDTLKGEKELEKITMHKPKSVGKLRGESDKSYEGDIPFVNRFLIDKDLHNGFIYKDDKIIPSDISISPRICYLDIEVASPKDNFPKPENAYYPITVMIFYDSYTNNYTVMTTKEVEIDENRFNLIVYRNEKEMLVQFLKYFNSLDFDVITGWNIGGFDLTYIKNRMKKKGISYRELSPLNSVYEMNNTIRIRGRSIFEMRDGYLKLRKSDLPSYQLDEVAKIELDDAKPIPIIDFEKTWEENPSKTIEHCYQDVRHLVRLDNEKRITDFFIELSRLAGCKLEDTLFNSRLVDMLMLREARDRNMVLPSREEIDHKDYKGGKVLSPKEGIHENVGVLDFSSAYPSIIQTFNISPDTKITGKGLNLFDKEERIDVNDNLAFLTSKKGLLPTISEKLSKQRKEKKKRMREASSKSERIKFDNQQRAIKYSHNSCYGVTGFPSFRLYDWQVASIITKLAREFVRLAAKEAEEENFEVVMGDTDGIDVKLGDNPIDTGEALVNNLNDKIHNHIKEKYGVSDPYIKLEFEELFSKLLLLPKKKKYAGKKIWEDGEEVEEYDYVGLAAGPRTTASKFTKSLQKALINLILEGEDKSKVKEIIKNRIRNFRMKEINPKEVGVPTKFRSEPKNYDKNTMWYQMWKRTRKLLGLKFEKGDKPLRIYINEGLVLFRRREQLSNVKIDWKENLNKSVKNKLEEILNMYDIKWKEVSPPQYTTLKDYGMG